MEDLTGQKFGKLTVLEFSHRKDRKYYWKCQCDCGSFTVINGWNLKSGNSKSCGCVSKEKIAKVGKSNKTHGQSHTRLHNIWLDIKKRCISTTNCAYRLYGERNIKVCNEWFNNYLCFYNWAINNGYADNLTIDRIDVNGNYEPSNCRWVTKKVQANNRRNNIYIVINGTRKTLAEWAEILNIKYWTAYRRYKKYKKLI